MNIIFLWILIGAIVGFFSSMVDAPFVRKNVTLSVLLGIVGASLGGIIGQIATYSSSQNFFVSPLLYIVMGSFLSVVVPSKDNLL